MLLQRFGIDQFLKEYRKQKTHPQKLDGSSLVAHSYEISNNLLEDFDKLLIFIEEKNS